MLLKMPKGLAAKGYGRSIGRREGRVHLTSKCVNYSSNTKLLEFERLTEFGCRSLASRT